MSRKAILLALVAALAAPAARAQSSRIEISGNAGWTLSDGVSGDPVVAGDGNVYNRLDPKDAFSFGFTLGYFLSENAEIEFQWDRQQSKLTAGGVNTLEIADMNVDTYHGVFSYNLGDEDDVARPFVFGGLGFTRYGSISFTDFEGRARSIDGQSKFSTTWGAGIKVYPGRSAGLRLGVRWTPTYIKSDAAGWWCDPWWGCYVVGNAQYSNQFEFSGGVTLRF